ARPLLRQRALRRARQHHELRARRGAALLRRGAGPPHPHLREALPRPRRAAAGYGTRATSMSAPIGRALPAPIDSSSIEVPTQLRMAPSWTTRRRLRPGPSVTSIEKAPLG